MASTSEYWVGDAIAEGSFGVVVYGRHKVSHLHVAIKCIDKASLKRHPARAIAIVHEQRILKRLKEHHTKITESGDTDGATSNDSFVVHLYASFHDAECVYLVMECCCGGTLQDLLDHYRKHTKTTTTMKLKLEATQHYGLQIIEGIAFLHSDDCNVIHCDIKPSNILLTDKGCIKIADFGCAIDLTTSNDTSDSSIKHRQLPMMERGTAPYSAPELNHQEPNPTHPVTPAVDLWSFGCILYALLHEQQSPFDKGSEVSTIESRKEFCNIIATGDRSKLLFGVDDASTLNNVTKDESLTFNDLNKVIFGLLDPCAEDRLKFSKKQKSDKQDISTSHSFADKIYPNIRSNLIQINQNIIEIRSDLLPPVPTWWTKNRVAQTSATSTNDTLPPDTNVLIDGASGWSAFLV
jgi:serine/threonine protein kinase